MLESAHRTSTGPVSPELGSVASMMILLPLFSVLTPPATIVDWGNETAWVVRTTCVTTIVFWPLTVAWARTQSLLSVLAS